MRFFEDNKRVDFDILINQYLSLAGRDEDVLETDDDVIGFTSWMDERIKYGITEIK